MFAYTVQAADEDDNGIWIGDPGHDTIPTFDLQAGQTIVSAVSGLRADLDHDVVGPQSDHKVDGSLTGADATLSSLTLSGITLVPAFAPRTTAYTATTSLSSTTVTIAISQGQNGATGRITAPNDADLNESGHQAALGMGDTTITVTVTSTNGDSTRTYTVTVTREAATDTTVPTVSSALVSADGTTVDIVFDEDLDTDLTLPANTQFTVAVDGTNKTPETVAFHASDADTITLTMTTADTIAAGAAVSVAYDKPTSNPLKDAADNEVESFTGQAAANRAAVDIEVSWAAESYAALEGHPGTTVTVTLSAVPTGDVTVPISASLGGGAEAADYSGVPTSVTFDSNSVLVDDLPTESFTVVATDDDFHDGDRQRRDAHPELRDAHRRDRRHAEHHDRGAGGQRGPGHVGPDPRRDRHRRRVPAAVRNLEQARRHPDRHRRLQPVRARTAPRIAATTTSGPTAASSRPWPAPSPSTPGTTPPPIPMRTGGACPSGGSTAPGSPTTTTTSGTAHRPAVGGTTRTPSARRTATRSTSTTATRCIPVPTTTALQSSSRAATLTPWALTRQ